MRGSIAGSVSQRRKGARKFKGTESRSSREGRRDRNVRIREDRRDRKEKHTDKGEGQTPERREGA